LPEALDPRNGGDFPALPTGTRLVSRLLNRVITMSPVTNVTYDRLRWWIVGAALFAAAVVAVSVANDVDAVSPEPAQISVER
jgi:hypothetical protein